MTVIVALEHLKLDDVVNVDPRAAAVGQESIYLEAGQKLTVADLVKGALIQSANDAADALALATAPSFPAFAAADERQGEAARAHRLALRPPRRARRAGRVLERPRRDAARARRR